MSLYSRGFIGGLMVVVLLILALTTADVHAKTNSSGWIAPAPPHHSTKANRQVGWQVPNITTHARANHTAPPYPFRNVTALPRPLAPSLPHHSKPAPPRQKVPAPAPPQDPPKVRPNSTTVSNVGAVLVNGITTIVKTMKNSTHGTVTTRKPKSTTKKINTGHKKVPAASDSGGFKVKVKFEVPSNIFRSSGSQVAKPKLGHFSLISKLVILIVVYCAH